jgi:enamine deaminase RidA (YjgF/YER057c/UK114 family)
VTDFYQRLAEKDWPLPEPRPPRGLFLPAVLHDGILTVSGKTSGSGRWACKGKAGGTVSVDQAFLGARQAVLNALAAAQEVLGDLNRVERVIRLTGYVNSTEDFGEQPEVMNGASEVLVTLFGEAGRHARTALGVAALPSGATVEVDLYLAVRAVPAG